MTPGDQPAGTQLVDQPGGAEAVTRDRISVVDIQNMWVRMVDVSPALKSSPIRLKVKGASGTGYIHLRIGGAEGD